jgi:hypothetical protein
LKGKGSVFVVILKIEKEELGAIMELAILELVEI